MPVNDDDGPKEGIDLRPNGSVDIWLDGRRLHLRNPRMRQYRKIRLAWRDALDEMSDRLQEDAAHIEVMAKARDERAEGGGDSRLTPEERAEDRRRGRETAEFREERCIAMWSLIVSELSDRSLGDEDDLPAFMVDMDGITDTVNHWQTVPSLFGRAPGQ